MENGAVHEAEIDRLLDCPSWLFRWRRVLEYCEASNQQQSTATLMTTISSPQSRHMLAVLNFSSPVCVMPISRHPRCLDENARQTEFWALGRCGDSSLTNTKPEQMGQSTLTLSGAIPRGDFQPWQAVRYLPVATSWSQSAGRMYQEISRRCLTDCLPSARRN